jgi:hypothetical protein
MMIVSHWLFGLMRNINHFSLPHRLIVKHRADAREETIASFAHPLRPLR